MTKVHSRLAVCAVAVIVGVLGMAAGAAAAASLGAGTYTQNFDTLASTGTSAVLPVGWALSESGTSANVNGQYTAGTGSSNAGDVYSYGASASTDRAFGTLLSGTLTPIIGASFTNDTGGTIGSLNVAYTGEEWRLGTSARGADRLDFQYNLTATDLVSLAGWIDVDGLDFSSPVTVGTVGALDGNAAANRTAVAATISGLSVAPGQTIWIRWTDFNASGADDGLGIDDFSISTGEPTEEAPRVVSTVPADGASDVALDANVTITFSEPVNVTGEWFGILCGLSETHVPSDTPVTGGPTTFTLNPDSNFGASLTCTVTVKASQVADQDTTDPPDNMATNHTFTFTTAAPPPPAVAIHDIQGASHNSPLVGPVSNVNGIVTAKRTNGFYMQDPNPDADDATSEGIFVFTSSSPGSVNVGDAVRVGGTVAEFRPGGSSSTNLATTEITGPTITVLSSGNALPGATVIGAGGRVPPTTVIEDDATGDVETSGVFDPAADGIDFYESLEGMLVQVNNPVAVGPRNSFGEIFVLADDGAGATVRTARGGILLRSNDANPERIQLDDEILPGSTPPANVGDHFNTSGVGILDYSFGNFELNLTANLTAVSGGLARESTAAPNANQLAVATFNVENLDANEPQSKFDALAGEIVNNLRSPDVIALEEIQDNNGATNDPVVDASATYTKLIDAISAAGGPAYEFRQIDPVDDQDGGEPGGNIRVGFLFRTDRGLAFVDRPGGGSTTPTTIVSGPDGPELSASPGRVAPTETAWNSSRKPLAGEFMFRGQKLFLIANHFNSKGGDHPLYGRFQPPVRSSEIQRHQQAQLVNNFVDSILAVDVDAKVIVLGDINDFEFSQTVSILKGTPPVLQDLMDTLPLDQRYSYVFDGNSQVLDHIVVSNSLFASPFEFDPVHVNAEFFDQLSDHDPSVARFTFNAVPSADAGGPYSVQEGGTVQLSATGNDPEGDTLTFTWDLDDNGTFETTGQTVTFSAANLDGPSTQTVAVRVSDGATSATDQASVAITNVAPTATFSAPATTLAGFPFTIALTGASDPSAADTTAGFTYSFDCGDGSGYGAFGSASSASCATADTTTRTVAGKIRDKDGGVTEYQATVRVVVTFDSLCALVRTYSSDPSVADTLCAKLADAANASTATARAGHLNAFRNQVDAKTGKAFTPEQAAVLKLLSTEL
jgi:predicted extracellular nuclease